MNNLLKGIPFAPCFEPTNLPQFIAWPHALLCAPADPEYGVTHRDSYCRGVFNIPIREEGSPDSCAS